MHIILGLLSSIITILVLLNKLAEAGFDIGGLNPFLWQRRRKWRNQYVGNPMFQIESPRDAAGILLVAAAKADGGISLEEKKMLQTMFQTEFNLSAKDAAGLLISSVHLVGDGEQLRSNIAGFLAPSKESFSAAQTKSTLKLLENISNCGGSVHPNTKEFIAEISNQLQANPESDKTWQP